MGNIRHAGAEDTIEMTGNGEVEGEPGGHRTEEDGSTYPAPDRLPEPAEIPDFISAP